jgi:hypothetical protein
VDAIHGLTTQSVAEEYQEHRINIAHSIKECRHESIAPNKAHDCVVTML